MESISDYIFGSYQYLNKVKREEFINKFQGKNEIPKLFSPEDMDWQSRQGRRWLGRREIT
jgi:hypothetical protein